jgi:undecaprenyl-diphosphatase
LKTKLSKNEQALAAVCIAFLLGFLLVTFLRGSLSATDFKLHLWMQSINKSPFTSVAEGIAVVFDTSSLVLISAVIATFLFYKKLKAQSLLLLGAMGGDALLISVLKNIIQSPRPIDGVISDLGFSFPSGHTAGSLVFCGTLAFFAWQHWRSRRVHVSVGIGVGAVTVAVGFSRVYLNLHWFSDILGAGLLGVFWLSFVVLVFKLLQDKGKFQSRRFQRVASVLFYVGVAVAVIVALVTVFS